MMNSKHQIQSYLFFSGRCEEALEFYRTALGAEVQMILRFNECPDPVPADMLAGGFENKIMHASLKVGDSILMASDGCGQATGFDGFSLSLTLPDEAACQKAFAALSAGGEVTMPLGKTFWSPCFGMVKDPFGVGWMITIPEG